MNTNPDAKCLFLFATPVITVVLDDFVSLNEALKAKIYDRERSDSGLQKSNFGGWHSKDDMLAWAPKESSTLLQAAIATITPYTSDVHPTGKRDFEFDANMWANINRKGHANNGHTHPGSLWSGTYYVDSGHEGENYDGGEFIVEDPRFPMNAMYMPSLVTRDQHGEPQSPQHRIKPKPGTMVLCPSWLRHSVRPHLGNKDRISVGFNLMVNEVIG